MTAGSAGEAGHAPRRILEAVRALAGPDRMAGITAERPTLLEYEEWARGAEVERWAEPPPGNAETPLVSVLIATWNAAEHLEYALDSIFSQEYPAIEVIVVDGGSSDETLPLVRRHRGRVHQLFSGPDAGLYDALNRGIALSRGTIIKHVNADDSLTAGSVAAAVARVRAAGDDCCVRGFMRAIAPDGSEVQMVTPRNRPVGTPDYFPVRHPTWYLPKRLFARLGLYLPWFRISGDTEYLHHMARQGVEFVEVEEPLAEFRLGGMSTGYVNACETVAINRHYFGRARSLAQFAAVLGRKGRFQALAAAVGEERAERWRLWLKNATRTGAGGDAG